MHACMHASALRVMYVESCAEVSMKVQAVSLECDVPGTRLPIIHYCDSDKHIFSLLTGAAAIIAVQSCPTLVTRDAYTVVVPLTYISTSLSQYQTRVIGRRKAARHV